MKTARAHPELAACLLLFLFFSQVVLAGPRLSLTADEPVHMAQGYVYWVQGDFRLQPAIAQPPLPDLLAGIGLALQPGPPPETLPGWTEADLTRFVRAFVKWYGDALAAATFAARVPILLVSTLGLAVVFRWTRERFGWKGGLLALALCVFDPNLLAHAGLATTDMLLAVWSLVAIYAATHAGAGVRWIALAGLALGLALGSKTSGFFPVAIVGLLFAINAVQDSWMFRNQTPSRIVASWTQWIIRFVLAVGIASLTLWALYRFQIQPLPGSRVLIPFASHWAIWQALQTHLAEGHTAFLSGQVSPTGWWMYYPIAFALKTPLPTLAIIAAALIALLARPKQGWRDRDAWIFPALYGLAALSSTIDIGYRYLLALLPFLYVLAGRLWPRENARTWRKSLIQFALVWLVAVTVRLFPNYLVYFNELTGGTENGYRYLVDSNLDWGQSFIELRQWLASHPGAASAPLYLSYYTFADPSLYDIRYRPIAPSPGAPPILPSRFNPAPGVYAIGATTLQGVMLADPDTFAWFRPRQPIARPGSAIFVYEVKSPERVPRWVAQCVQPAPPLEPEVIAEGFGRDDLRLTYWDCTQSWLLPAGGQSPGWYALHRAVLATGDRFVRAWLGRANLSYEQRTDRDSPAFSIYEQPDTLPGPACAAEPVTLDGPLTFRGFTVSQSTARPGDLLEVETCWQVTAIPRRPLSIMLHLSGPDGIPRLVADGLGVPIEQWQTGDVIVQRHKLQIPIGAPRGRYQLTSGAYWLDTLARWPTSSGSDVLSLLTIGIKAR